VERLRRASRCAEESAHQEQQQRCVAACQAKAPDLSGVGLHEGDVLAKLHLLLSDGYEQHRGERMHRPLRQQSASSTDRTAASCCHATDATNAHPEHWTPRLISPPLEVAAGHSCPHLSRKAIVRLLVVQVQSGAEQSEADRSGSSRIKPRTLLMTPTYRGIPSRSI
jgi:hypothetical protein